MENHNFKYNSDIYTPSTTSVAPLDCRDSLEAERVEVLMTLVAVLVSIVATSFAPEEWNHQTECLSDYTTQYTFRVKGEVFD